MSVVEPEKKNDTPERKRTERVVLVANMLTIECLLNPSDNDYVVIAIVVADVYE